MCVDCPPRNLVAGDVAFQDTQRELEHRAENLDFAIKFVGNDSDADVVIAKDQLGK
jgi:hypothetical protein